MKRFSADRIFSILGISILIFILIGLGFLVGGLLYEGSSRLTYQFLSSYPSRFPDKAGILSALVGSVLLVSVTALVSVPIGVAAGIYLEEYGRKGKGNYLLELAVANLAGIPSILLGLLGLGLLAQRLSLGQSIATGGITLGFLVLPLIIVATREGLRSIPSFVREAAYSVGATKWELVWHHLLPYASGSIVSGVIISISRALGETAPLITIGALTYIAFLPPLPLTSSFPFVSFEWLGAPFTALPIQMYNWLSRPNPAFHMNAAACGVILLLVSLALNAAVIVYRYKRERRFRW